MSAESSRRPARSAGHRNAPAIRLAAELPPERIDAACEALFRLVLAALRREVAANEQVAVDEPVRTAA